jgi:DNA-binding protein H-NS
MLGTIMPQEKLQSKSIDELWALREEIAVVAKMAIEKDMLEDRLTLLNRARGRATDRKSTETSSRRQYPIVHPKFRNPDEPSQTWAGRGERPRWLVAKLRLGRAIDDFRIETAAAQGHFA